MLKPRGIIFSSLVILFGTAITLPASALTFPLPTDGSNIVGQIQTATIKSGDTFAQVARNYDMGYTELEEANPDVDPEHPAADTVLIVPSQFILPPVPREGIVVNLAEMRLYYYPPGKNQVITYPIGIGREGEDTPLGELKIIEHTVKPTWHVPESIRKMRAAQGVDLPKQVPPGPDNPLGEYAMRFSKPTYLMHGTNDPLGGIGRRSSSGCLRLYPEDIQSLFYAVPNGTKVTIINQPYKVGWASGKLYLESHVALNKKPGDSVMDITPVKMAIDQALTVHPTSNINWDEAFAIAQEEQGLPQVVGG